MEKKYYPAPSNPARSSGGRIHDDVVKFRRPFRIPIYHDTFAGPAQRA